MHDVEYSFTRSSPTTTSELKINFNILDRKLGTKSTFKVIYDGRNPPKTKCRSGPIQRSASVLLPYLRSLVDEGPFTFSSSQQMLLQTHSYVNVSVAQQSHTFMNFLGGR